MEYSNPPKASGFLGPSRCEQGLLNPNPPQKLVLPHKMVRHTSLTNWDEENVNPLHTARAGTYCLDVSFGMVCPYIQADANPGDTLCSLSYKDELWHDEHRSCHMVINLPCEQ